MLYNIQYVYGNNKDEEKTLVGAIILGFDGYKTYSQEIYVGLEVTLEDIMKNKEKAEELEVETYNALKAKYELLGNKGMVYFPQLGSYEFLEEGDVVIPWESPERVSSSLESVLQPYRNNATEMVVRNKMAAKKAYIENLDPEDSMVELYGLSLGKRTSSR